MLIFKYNEIQNCFIKNNGSNEKQFNNNVVSLSKYNNNNAINNFKFNSIGDVQDSNNFLINVADFGLELSGENISLNRILEMLDLVKYSYDLFVLLKKISNFINSNEFTDEIIYLTKEKLLKKIIDIQELFFDGKNEISMDKFIIPAIFNLLRKIFFKTKSAGKDKCKIRRTNSEKIIKSNCDFDKIKNVIINNK